MSRPEVPRASSSAPGKLYIAGEYAVVEPGHQAILVAVDRFITVSITAAQQVGRIRSALHGGRALAWHRRQDGAAQVEGRGADYVISAIRVVEELVRERGGRLRIFDLEVVSELVDGGSGRKLGLGSSSAVTVATVRAVARLYGLGLDDMEVYRLALMASDDVEPIGSGGDIAASAFTGWVAYSSPDRGWLRRERRRRSTGGLLAAHWPCLSIRRLEPPGLCLQVGWTGAPASSPRLVAGVRGRVARDARYAAFLTASQDCVSALVRAVGQGDHEGIGAQIRRNRGLLADLGRASGITIETPGLRRLVEIAQDHGAAAKSSGAGGGDCGIALCPPGTDTGAMRARWRAGGIEPLDLAVHCHDGGSRGAHPGDGDRRDVG
ncbi:phosphomevalonate kinase [Actinomyces bowdenii]|uniref:phosphomevalonate kinase n=1 Tax=Actinomyces bowdenii TaxID=131109 RepID=UPI001ABC2A5A|nr:phosphomevalonate kinase [Actinomyces bowdenii]